MNEPVLLLHGLARGPASMALLGRVLQRDGFTPIYFRYPSRHASIESHINALRTFIDEQHLRGVPCHAVGHSLGSVIITKAAKRWPEEFNLQRAVFLGPPLRGSRLARTLESWRPFRAFFGPVLSELASMPPVELPPTARCASITGTFGRFTLNPFLARPNDGIVGCDETSVEGLADSIFLNAGLHATLPLDPRVLKLSLRFLSGKNFTDR